MSQKEAIILVVDDNPTNLSVLFDFFKTAPYELSSANNGKAALEIIEIEKPDLVLLDVLMPEMDGYETCHRLKENPETRAIPIIFMTALSDTIDKLKGFEAGAVDYITKPFDCEEVLARVRTHLTIQNLQRQLARKNEELQSKNAELHAALTRERELLERERAIIEELRLNLSLSLPHELRTPLASILGFSEVLCDPGSDPQTIRLGKKIYDSGLRLQRLIENYMLYANLKLIKYQSMEKRAWQRHTNIDTRGFLADFATKKAIAENRQTDLVLDLVDAQVQISPESLSKIVAEVLDNSFKFSTPGSAIQITTRADGDHFVLSVTDHGRGMAPEQIKSIGAFMQFNRRQMEQQGSGLGLVISMLLARLEGGEFKIDSTQNQKTTVSLIFNNEHLVPVNE